jgi:hypothetical protein
MPTFVITPSWQLKQKRMTVLASWALVRAPELGRVTEYVDFPSPLKLNVWPYKGVRSWPHRAYIPF